MSAKWHPVLWRFWSKVDILSHPGGCWLWTATKTYNGYGLVYISGFKSAKASRVVWELTHHKPFPDGLIAMHSCDNPACVNPHHIQPGTHSQNLKDAYSRGLTKPHGIAEGPAWNRGVRSLTCGKGHSRAEFGRNHGLCRACDAMRDATRTRKKHNEVGK